MFPEDSGALFILNKEKNVLEAVTHWGKTTPKALVFHPDDCWALRRGQDHLVKDPANELLCGHLENTVTTGSLCVPMIAHGENLGLLLLIKNSREASEDEPRSDSRQRLATTAARQIALTIANLNLKNHLMQQAIRDPLTGLFNRRYMEETLEREIFRVMRKDAPLGIIMADLDHFKKFNDTLGHVAGDVLLQTIGNLLRSNIRREDIACRYGGDEFVLILPEAPLEITQQRAEKLRQEVEKLQLDYRGRTLGQVTISLGVAAFPAHGDQVVAILKAADTALYQAKEGGRNRVETAEAETAVT
jgi:diguanylate cyclase (GGDEF)-like protein